MLLKEIAKAKRKIVAIASKSENRKNDSYILSNEEEKQKPVTKRKLREINLQGVIEESPILLKKTFRILSAPILFLPTVLTNLSINNNNKFDQKKVNFSGASCLSGECLFYVGIMVAGIIFLDTKKKRK